MTCGTCGHTMNCLTVTNNGTVYVCPRCGTVRQVHGDSHTDYVPKLIDRCREFQGVLVAAMTQAADAPCEVAAIDVWTRLGIAESINVAAPPRPE